MPAIEENANAPEHMPVAKRTREPMPGNEIVNQFRTDIYYWFNRYQLFYDRANAAMRGYRFGHVDLITHIYNQLLAVFGDNIEALQQTSNEFNALITERQATLGEDNSCLREIVEGQRESSFQTSSTIQSCAIYANGTLSNLSRTTFYPAFASIQNTISSVNNAVVDVLSRGNILEDERAIIEYLRANYGVKEFQWLSAVSQLLRWETNRFTVEGSFLVDEMGQCMSRALIQFITTNAGLTNQARSC